MANGLILSDDTGLALASLLEVGSTVTLRGSLFNAQAEADDSILVSIKKYIGLDRDYHEFDSDIIMFINSALFNLRQLGVGPIGGFAIDSENQTWHEFVDDDSLLSGVKPYIQQKVRLQFDPPSNSFVEASIRKNIEEYEWRLNIQGEGGFNES